MSLKRIADKIKLNTSKDNKNLMQRLAKLTEETGELAQELLTLDKAPGCTYKTTSREDILQEACDVIIVASSILCQLEFRDSEFKDMMYKKLDKWEEVLERDKPE